MDSFSSPSMSSSGSQPSTEAVMEQIKTQLAQAYAQEFMEASSYWASVITDSPLAGLLEKEANSWARFVFIDSAAAATLAPNIPWFPNSRTLGTKCFAKCVTKPGTSLTGSESSCISRCVERYIEATGIVSRALFSQR
ncbi:hypothetical protein ACQ4PT_070931 [Festuca glaucescens]